MGKNIDLDQIKLETNNKQKENKNMEKETKKALKREARKPKIELAKTIIITILVTAVIAFIGGIKYQESNTNAITSKAKELSVIVKE